jgi:aminopeptidase-like protein
MRWLSEHEPAILPASDLSLLARGVAGAGIVNDVAHQPELGRATSVNVLSLIESLYPICRSITGNGVRQTLKVLQDYIPLDIHDVATGTQVFDWVIPREWNIRQAFLARLDGTKIVDFAAHNLHILQYSTSIDRVIEFDELRPHLHTISDQPSWIPYRTAYYSENWGFCLSENQLATLQDARYRAFIDSSLEDGHLTFGELFIPGRSDETVLISTHICHPSLANDNLSGIAVATALAQHIRSLNPRYSYRFLFIPGTIGSITWLALNEDKLKAIKCGLVLSCLGDAGGMTYKQSRQGDTLIDRIVSHLLRHDLGPSRVVPFEPFGYDERQYCSPGFNLPVGCLMRTQPGGYPEYHTSADNLDFLSAESLDHSLAMLQKIVSVIEGNAIYRNCSPRGEPQLGRRGLYRAMGGQSSAADGQMALLWVLNLSDGTHSLLDIAERAGLPFPAIRAAADSLAATDLLKLED